MKIEVTTSYSLPNFQDTMMIACFNGMSFDRTIWSDSDPNLDCSKFRPERFIKDGKITVPDRHYPFGVGKHRCMGELMARANIFLFTTTLLQHFNFLVPPGHPLPTDGKEFNSISIQRKLKKYSRFSVPVDGATASVQQYTALIVNR